MMEKSGSRKEKKCKIPDFLFIKSPRLTGGHFFVPPKKKMSYPDTTDTAEEEKHIDEDVVEVDDLVFCRNVFEKS